MHRGGNALFHSPYGAFSGIATFYLVPLGSEGATWVGTIGVLVTNMRDYTQEVARPGAQRTRDLDNKGNNQCRGVWASFIT